VSLERVSDKKVEPLRPSVRSATAPATSRMSLAAPSAPRAGRTVRRHSDVAPNLARLQLPHRSERILARLVGFHRRQTERGMCRPDLAEGRNGRGGRRVPLQRLRHLAHGAGQPGDARGHERHPHAHAHGAVRPRLHVHGSKPVSAGGVMLLGSRQGLASVGAAKAP
jgi:hypothetical protein